MVLSDTRRGCGATETPGDSEGSGAGMQRAENGIFHMTGLEETGIMPGTKSNLLVRPRGQ